MCNVDCANRKDTQINMSSKLYALLSTVPGSIRVLSKTNTQKGGGRGGSSKLLPVFVTLCSSVKVTVVSRGTQGDNLDKK